MEEESAVGYDFSPCPKHFLWGMRWTKKMLKVRRMLSELLSNTSGSMYRCIIVSEVSFSIRIKMQHCRVYFICRAVCLLSRSTRAPLPSHQNMTHIMITLKILIQCQSDKMDSWPRSVLAKFDVYHRCKIRCSVIMPTTLTVYYPQMSSDFFPDTNVNEFLRDGQK